MADTYTWDISQLDRKLSDGVVYIIHWGYTASRTVDSKDYTQRSYGSLSLKTTPTPDPLIPYADLTKDKIIEWLTSELDVDSMKTNLTAGIDLQVTPVDGYGVPW